MSKPRQKDNVQCAFCGKKMQLRSIGGHWRMLGHPNNVNLDDRYLCIEEESSSTSDSSSNANDSSSNDGSTTTSNDGSSSNDEDDSDEEEIQDTIPMDVDNEDHSPPRQMNDGIDDDQFFDAELMDVINAHFERLEDEDVQQRPDDVEEEEKGEELDD
eukprot:348976_1